MAETIALVVGAIGMVALFGLRVAQWVLPALPKSSDAETEAEPAAETEDALGLVSWWNHLAGAGDLVIELTCGRFVYTGIWRSYPGAEGVALGSELSARLDTLRRQIEWRIPEVMAKRRPPSAEALRVERIRRHPIPEELWFDGQPAGWVGMYDALWWGDVMGSYYVVTGENKHYVCPAKKRGEWETMPERDRVTDTEALDRIFDRVDSKDPDMMRRKRRTVVEVSTAYYRGAIGVPPLTLTSSSPVIFRDGIPLGIQPGEQRLVRPCRGCGAITRTDGYCVRCNLAVP